MSGPVLLHVGLHKTGSTWLQRQVFAARNGRELAYCGDVGRIHSALILPEVDQFDPMATRASFADVLDQARAGEKLAVLSDEALGGRPFHAKYQREIHAERLAATFPEAHVLITIREQRRIVHSIYGQYLRYGHAASLRDFLAPAAEGSIHHPILERAYYDYSRMAQIYGRHFPPERLLIVPMEWMLSDPSAALGMISARTGVTLPAPAADLGGRVENPALSDLGYEAMRAANRLVAQDSRALRRIAFVRPNVIGYWADRLTPAILRRRMREARLAQIDALIGSYYAKSNAALSAQIGLDLARFGYRTL